MNGKHQLLFYADDVNILGENLQTVRENIEFLIKARKKIGLEVNSEKTNAHMSPTKYSIVQNQNIVIENLSFENVEKCNDLGLTVTNTNTFVKKLNAE